MQCDAFDAPEAESVADPSRISLSRFEALALVRAAFTSFFTDHAADIDAAFDATTFDVGAHISHPRAPYTLHHEDGTGAQVVCLYRNLTVDLMALAHECGHALQLSLCKTRFMPPIHREICAFLGEQALMAYCAQHSPSLFAQLEAVWHAENGIYLGVDACTLSSHASSPEAPYDYRWNYPIARLAAIRFWQAGSAPELWGFLCGHTALWDAYLAELTPSAEEFGMENYLPELPETDPERPALNAFRAIGAMTLMDVDYWEGHSRTKIGDYFEGLLEHLRSGTAFICAGADKKPLGYATWIASADGQITLTHRAAPFGNHLELLQSLQARIPNCPSARSTHARSARQEQVAW